MTRVLLWVWGLFLLSFPFYVARSGQPQVSTVVTAILFFLLLAVFRLPIVPAAGRLISILGVFVGYVTLVNWTWVVAYGHSQMAVVPMFYLYNFLVVVSFLSIYSILKDKALLATALGVGSSVLLQVALLPVSYLAGGFRQVLFFNNPNQLGYFALLSATILIAAGSTIRLPTLFQNAALAGSVLLVLLSLSNASMLAMAMLFTFAFVQSPKYVVLIVGLLGVAYPLIDSGVNLVENVIYRLGTIGLEADNSLLGRGYDRLLNHPEYLVLGAGEGATSRFQSVLPGELHSSWGTLLFSYGILGTTLFAAFVFEIYKVCSNRMFLFLAPTFLYGITHQGLRFTFFWTMLVVVYCAGLELRRGAGAQQRVIVAQAVPVSAVS